MLASSTEEMKHSWVLLAATEENRTLGSFLLVISLSGDVRGSKQNFFRATKELIHSTECGKRHTIYK